MTPDRFLPRCGDWLCTRPEHRPFAAWAHFKAQPTFIDEERETLRDFRQAHPAEAPDSARQDVLDVALAIVVLVLVALAGSLVAVHP